MRQRYFIENQELVKDFLKELLPTGNQPDYFGEIYVHPGTGDKWEEYEFEFDGEAVGLRKLPYPSTDEIINIALNSPDLDEVDGAAGLLLEQEDYKIYFREKLLKQIETKLSEITKERFEVIYFRAELYDPANKREIVGKHILEIENDAMHFKAMSDKAEGILKSFEN